MGFRFDFTKNRVKRKAREREFQITGPMTVSKGSLLQGPPARCLNQIPLDERNGRRKGWRMGRMAGRVKGRSCRRGRERLEEVKRERLEDGWWGRGVGEVRGEEVARGGEVERGWKRERFKHG